MTALVVDEQVDVEVDVDRVRVLAEFVLADQGVDPRMELTVICVDVSRITELNGTHMGSDGPTDVLAFPLDAPDEVSQEVEAGLLGDVILCPEVAVGQAADLGRTPQQEVDLLVVHGILHVLGHDHAEMDEKAVMFSLTDRLLADFASAGEPAP